MSLLPRHDTSGLSDSEMAETLVDPYELAPNYALGVVYFCIALLGIFVASRAILALRKRFASIVSRSTFYQKTTAVSRYMATKQHRLLGVHFPVLGVSLVIFAFFVFTMGWTWGTMPYYRSRWNVGGSPLALRSGFMALGCFPFLMASASKWNFITLLTGYSHEKLQVYHQWVSYIFVVLSLIHSFPWLVQGMAEVKPGFEPLTQIEWSWHIAHKVYYWTGAALLIILAWLSVASLPPIRKRFYESFKYLHIISGLMFLGFFFVHCNQLLGSWDYLIATTVIYGLAAVFRILWMVHSNSSGMARAKFEVMGAGMVKLTIMGNPLEQWKPGQHYFLHFVTVMPFQSHPFTIASIPNLEPGELQELVVLIRAAHGVTKRLETHLSAKGEEEKTQLVPVLLDGPFGGLQQDLSIYDHVLLVAGGTGITFVLPVLQGLVRKSNLAGKDGVLCRSIHLVWSVRDEESLSWANADIEATVRKSIHASITVQLHVTGTAPSSASSDAGSETKASSQVAYERANVGTLVRNAGAENKTFGVAVCGPEGLVYDVRNAVASLQKDIALGKPGCNEVFLHSEEYSW